MVFKYIYFSGRDSHGLVRRRAAAGIEAIDGGDQKSLRVAPTIGAGITTAPHAGLWPKSWASAPRPLPEIMATSTETPRQCGFREALQTPTGEISGATGFGPLRSEVVGEGGFLPPG
jgi:hypothetical protein